jgi:hypothetical protein
MGRTPTARAAGERAECRGLFSPASSRARRRPTTSVNWLPQQNMFLGANHVRTGTASAPAPSTSVHHSMPLDHSTTCIVLCVPNSAEPHAWPWILEAMCEPAKAHGHSTALLPHGNHLHWERSARINKEKTYLNLKLVELWRNEL